MAKHVHSRDPRKAAIVAALKAKSGGSKVTLLREVAPDTFTGSCLRQIRSACNPQGIARVRFEQIGEFTVSIGSESVPAKVAPATLRAATSIFKSPGRHSTRAPLVQLVGSEVEDTLAAIELALEEKRKALAVVKHEGFTARDFGIPQLETLEARFQAALL